MMFYNRVATWSPSISRGQPFEHAPQVPFHRLMHRSTDGHTAMPFQHSSNGGDSYSNIGGVSGYHQRAPSIEELSEATKQSDAKLFADCCVKFRQIVTSQDPASVKLNHPGKFLFV